MKFLAISGLVALLSASAFAAPTPADEIEARTFSVTVTFTGGDPKAKYTLSIPADGSVVTISNPLSISHITSSGGATCGFTGSQGSQTTTVGAQTVDVGPPQPQIKATCRAF